MINYFDAVDDGSVDDHEIMRQEAERERKLEILADEEMYAEMLFDEDSATDERGAHKKDDGDA